MTEASRKNREHWDRESDNYETAHGAQLASAPLAWGVWSIPESELHVLGDVRDKDVLELGCGAARWSIALAKLGARCVGLDNSERQLVHARRLMAEAGVAFPLLHAAAEAVPLPDATFDIVFCDHGAMSFTDPRLSVAEAARLLRGGGLFAFNAETPMHFVCFDEKNDRISEQLQTPYFDTRSTDADGSVNFSLPYGEWIRLFRRCGFAIEDLVELRPPPEAQSSYQDWVSREWASKWAAEQIWRLRRL